VRSATGCSLHHVGVDLDAAIVADEREALPARQGIADRLGESGLLADRAGLSCDPGFELVQDRPETFGQKRKYLRGVSRPSVSTSEGIPRLLIVQTMKFIEWFD